MNPDVKTRLIKKYATLGILLLTIALPITLFQVRQNQDNRSSAAATDKLEAEGGVLSNGASIKPDSSASGGSYVELNSSTPTPTPTQTTTTSSPYGPRVTPSTPTGTNVYIVSSSIDGTGNTNVSIALQNFINTVPNGSSTTRSIIVFPAGKTYNVSPGLYLQNDSYITFWGYGATLKLTGVGDQTRSSGFYIQNSNNLKILGLRILGNNDLGGTTDAYGIGGEYSMGVLGRESTNNIEIADNHISNTYGDGIYWASYSTNPAAGNNSWNIHHNLIEKTGRNGIVFDEGTNHYMEWNMVLDSALYPFDTEDMVNGIMPLTYIYIRNNYIDGWSWNTTYTPHAVTGDYSNGELKEMHHIYVENNIIKGGDQGPVSGSGYQYGVISFNGDMPKSEIYIRNNTFDLPSDQRVGAGVRLRNVTGGTVTGNTMPGQNVNCSSCVNVTTTPNP